MMFKSMNSYHFHRLWWLQISSAPDKNLPIFNRRIQNEYLHFHNKGENQGLRRNFEGSEWLGRWTLGKVTVEEWTKKSNTLWRKTVVEWRVGKTSQRPNPWRQTCAQLRKKHQQSPTGPVIKESYNIHQLLSSSNISSIPPMYHQFSGNYFTSTPNWELLVLISK